MIDALGRAWPGAYPPWLDWGKRGGTRINPDRFLAAFPDARQWRGRSYVGEVMRCNWCGQKLSGRRSSWCSSDCAWSFYRLNRWERLSEFVYQRDGRACYRCRCDLALLPKRSTRWSVRRMWEVDHILPIKDGGDDRPENLRLACSPCHLAAGKEQREARRAAAQASQLPLIEAR